LGTLTIEGIDSVFEVTDCLKVGKCVLHKVEPSIPDDVDIIGKAVNGTVDAERRA